MIIISVHVAPVSLPDARKRTEDDMRNEKIIQKEVALGHVELMWLS